MFHLERPSLVPKIKKMLRFKRNKDRGQYQDQGQDQDQDKVQVQDKLKNQYQDHIVRIQTD